MSAETLEARVAAARSRHLAWDEPRSARVRASVRRRLEARARRRAVVAAACGALLFALGLRALAPRAAEDAEPGPSALAVGGSAGPVARTVLDDGGAEGSVARR